MAFALSHKPAHLASISDEQYEIALFHGENGVLSSGLRTPEGFRGFTQRFTIRRDRRRRLRLVMQRLSWYAGRQIRTFIRLPLPPLTYTTRYLTGVVSGQAAFASGAARLRARAPSSRSRRTWVAPSPTPRSSTLRPNEFVTRPFLRRQETNSPSGNVVVTNTIVPYRVFSREWTGVRTPNWGKLKSKQHPDNPHTVRIRDVTQDISSTYQRNRASGFWSMDLVTYTLANAILGVQPHLTVAEFNALRRLITRAQVGVQANLAQNIAQVSQLSQLIVGNAMMIASSLRQLRRGNIPGAIGALGAGPPNPRWRGSVGRPSARQSLASQWLQLQYGWKPLLSDIEGFFKILGNLSGPTDQVHRVSSSASVTRVTTLAFPPAWSFSSSSVGKTTVVTRTTCKFSIRYRMDNPLLSLFAQTGFTNPINLFWEILPFSFVADWFLPIGSYLEALTAWDGMTFLGGSKVLFTKSKIATDASYHGISDLNAFVDYNFRSAYREEQINLDRTRLLTFPSPVTPSFNHLGLSAGNRAANAIALIQTVFGRRG